MTTQTTQLPRIIRIPFSVYTPDGYTDRALYVHARKTEEGTWYECMRRAQEAGCRLPTSAEWYQARKYLEQKFSKVEEDFTTGPVEWTGTVLDFKNEQLLEGITLGPDSEIVDVKTRLGREQGIVLPTEQCYVRTLDDRYIPLICHLCGIEDIGELPDYTNLYVQPSGLRPVVRGDWSFPCHNNRRVDVDAEYSGADRSFASRLVSETMPERALTPTEYMDMVVGLVPEAIRVE